ncbi:ABC transporter substrate-binding protein [Candidatus Woesearchaeota archaeon]|nr:ABC transporter substrate-binding protein [Candidatus Woesearchaeota archaeon]
MKKTMVFLLLIMFFVVVSCSKQESDKNLKDQGKEFTIGILATLTGPAAVHGTHVILGAEKAVEELANQGAKIKLVVEDNKNDPKEALTAYHALVASKPDVIFTTMSGASAAIIPLAAEENIPVVTSLTYADFQQYNNVYQYFQTPDTLTSIAVDFFKKSDITKVGLLSQNIEAGHALMDIAQKKFGEQGITVTGIEYYLPTDTDHKTVITKLAAQQPEAVYVFDLRPDTIVKELKEQYSGIIVFTDTPVATNQHKTVPTLEGVYAAAPLFMIEGTDQNKRFENLFAKTDANAEAGFGYDVIKLIWQSHLKGDLPKSILNLSNFEGLAGDIDVRNSRRPLLPMVMVKIQDKQLVKE